MLEKFAEHGQGWAKKDIYMCTYPHFTNTLQFVWLSYIVYFSFCHDTWCIQGTGTPRLYGGSNSLLNTGCFLGAAVAVT